MTPRQKSTAYIWQQLFDIELGDKDFQALVAIEQHLLSSLPPKGVNQSDNDYFMLNAGSLSNAVSHASPPFSDTLKQQFDNNGEFRRHLLRELCREVCAKQEKPS